MEKYQNSMDIITADGGFDFSIDFNKQEQLSNRLIFCEIKFYPHIKIYQVQLE